MENNYSTSFNKDFSMEISENEELLWQGKPQKASFILSKSVQLMPIALLWLAFDGFFISMLLRAKIPAGVSIFLIIFFAFHLMPVWMWIHSVLTARRKYKLIEYAFTDKRIIVKDNHLLKSYYYRELRSVYVKVGLIDKLFKVGDLTITGPKNLKLLDLDEPYAVCAKLQEMIEAHAHERPKRRRRPYHSDVEYDTYYDDIDDADFEDYDEEDYYQDDEIDRIPRHNEYQEDDSLRYENYEDSDESMRYNEYEEVDKKPRHTSSVSISRFTSKRRTPRSEETVDYERDDNIKDSAVNEEDEYLDNILDSIDNNKKQDF